MKDKVPYEEAAEVRTVTGWVCKHCGRYYGNNEHAARWCCRKDRPCETCGGRTDRSYIKCDSCREKDRLAKWLALPEVEWDGTTPLVVHGSDHYFFNADDLGDWLADDVEMVLSDTEAAAEMKVALDDVRLCLCKQVEPRGFDISDFLHDDVEEDWQPDPKALAAEKVVNDYIATLTPLWTQTNKRPSLASLRKALGLDV